MISGMNSWKIMNSGVPRSVLAKNSYQNSYMNSWKIMNYEFMKKTYDFGCTKKRPASVKEFLYMNSYINTYSHLWIHIFMKTFFCEFIYELIYENHVFQCIWFHMWYHRSELRLNSNTYWRGEYFIIFAKYLVRFFLQICSAGLSSILSDCHLRNLQSPQHVHNVPLTPARLHVSICSTWAFLARDFGAWAFAVRDCSFDLTFRSLGFWSSGLVLRRILPRRDKI